MRLEKQRNQFTRYLELRIFPFPAEAKQFDLANAILLLSNQLIDYEKLAQRTPMKKCLILLERVILERVILKIIISCILFVFFTSSAFAGAPTNIIRIADCKIKKSRIITYQFDGSPTTQDMTDYLNNNGPSHTNGLFTASYFFKKGTRMPVSGFSNCGSIMNGNMFLYESNQIDPWDFAYIQSRKGDRVVINCKENSAHKLCKQ